MLDVKKATTKELVEFYNDHTDKPVVKFRDRATAEKRCLQAAQDFGIPLKQDDLEIIIKPSTLVKPATEGAKIARVIDALWEGATESEVLAILGVTKKTRANTAKFNHWLRWNVAKDKGYGIAKRIEDGAETYYAIMKDGAAKIPHKRKGE